MTDIRNENVTDEDMEDTFAPESTDNDDITDDAPSPSETQKNAKADTAEGGIDYESLIESDVAELRNEFPELKGIKNVTELNNPLRYAALRDLGLSPAEAYLATARRYKSDTRSHLKSAHGRNAARSVSGMSYAELTAARDLFPGKNDAEIERLYKRVSK